MYDTTPSLPCLPLLRDIHHQLFTPPPTSEISIAKGKLPPLASKSLSQEKAKQNRPPKELDSALNPGTFIYLADYKLVVCKPCGFAVDARNFRHVDSMPHRGMEWSKHQRRLLKQFIQSLDVISPEDAPPLPDSSPPIPELPIFNGF
jgi:hypothetical protein